MHYVYDRLAHDENANQTPHYGHIDGDGDCILIAPGLEPASPMAEDLIVPSRPPPESDVEGAAVPVHVLAFSANNGYRDPSLPRFGRNDYSQRLGNVEYANGSAESRALSWLAVVFEPSSPQMIDFKIGDQATRFRAHTPQGEGPEKRFVPPREVATTISSLVFSSPLSYGSDLWANFVRITRDGNMEYCDSFHTYFAYQDMRAFRYVQIIGMVWQYIFFVHDTLAAIGYNGGGTLLFNLVGARDTILADFATDPGPDGRKWIEPGDRGILNQGEGLLNLKCPDPNLQLTYSLAVGTIDEVSARAIIDDLAEQLGLAYNHQTAPRCFIHGTDQFPWDRYFAKRR